MAILYCFILKVWIWFLVVIRIANLFSGWQNSGAAAIDFVITPVLCEKTGKWWSSTDSLFDNLLSFIHYQFLLAWLERTQIKYSISCSCAKMCIWIGTIVHVVASRPPQPSPQRFRRNREYIISRIICWHRALLRYSDWLEALVSNRYSSLLRSCAATLKTALHRIHHVYLTVNEEIVLESERSGTVSMDICCGS